MYVTEPPCPNCGHQGAYLWRQFTVIGPASVAGVQLKVSAIDVPWWQCGDCGAYGHAHPPVGFRWDEGEADHRRGH